MWIIDAGLWDTVPQMLNLRCGTRDDGLEVLLDYRCWTGFVGPASLVQYIWFRDAEPNLLASIPGPVYMVQGCWIKICCWTTYAGPQVSLVQYLWFRDAGPQVLYDVMFPSGQLPFQS